MIMLFVVACFSLMARLESAQYKCLDGNDLSQQLEVTTEKRSEKNQQELCSRKNKNISEGEPKGSLSLSPDSGTTKPGDFGTTKPGDSGTTKPGDAGTTKPGDSGTTKPGDSGTNKPGDSGTTKPGDASTTKPGDYGTAKPRENGTTKPEDGGTTKPGDAGTTKPGVEATLSTPSVNETDTTKSEMVTAFPASSGTIITTPYVVNTKASCRQICGQIRDFPCSCDLKCLVYNNCCEDMVTVCPKVLEESRIRYGHMLDMKVECSKQNVFVITECVGLSTTNLAKQKDVSVPFETKTTFVPSSTSAASSRMDNPTVSTRNEDATLQDREQSIDSTYVLTSLTNAYITDAATGFVFKNLDVYSCAARENSRPLKWDGALFSSKRFDGTNIRSILRAVCNGNMGYDPPAGVDRNMTGTMCYFGARKCEDTTMQRDLRYLSQCQQFISYAWTKYQTYQNIYCALCENAKNITYSLDGFSKPDVDVTVRLAERNNSIRFSKKDRDLKIGAWLEATCDLSQSNSHDFCSGDIHCETSQCSTPTFRRPDGNCKFLHYFTLAVSDDGYPLSQHEYNAFPEFARCFIKSYVGLDIDDDLSPTEVLLDDRYNRNLYVTKIYVYDTRPDLTKVLTEPMDTAQMSRLFLMSKSFNSYKKSKINESRRHSTNSVKSNMKRIYSHDFRHYFPVTQVSTNETDELTITCLCSMLNVYPTRRAPVFCPLACAQDPMFDGDSQAVAAYLNSTCFSVFDNKGNGVHRSATYGIMMIVLFVFGLVL